MIKKIIVLILLLILLVAIIIYTNLKKDGVMNNDDLIPRQDIFNNPDRLNVKISHNGKYISYLAPHEGVLNIYIAPINNIDSSILLTKEKKRGVSGYNWAHDSTHILYSMDNDGDENWSVFSINIENNNIVNLLPFDKSRSDIVKFSHHFPSKILIQNNNRSKSYFDIYEVDLQTNEHKIIFENNEYSGFVFDENLKLSFLMKSNQDGGVSYFSYIKGQVTNFMDIPVEDVTTTGIVKYDASDNKLYYTSSIDSNTSKLIVKDLNANNDSIIFHSEKADISNILFSEVNNKLLAVGYNYLKNTMVALDNDFKKHLDFINSYADGEVNITSMDFNNLVWVVAYSFSHKPHEYYLYDAVNMKMEYLFNSNKKLASYSFEKMDPKIIKTRDGLDLVSYLTLPNHSNRKLPLVLLVHGGPSVRDSWGFNPLHQLLANRGYAVLSVNYRGSTGFGKNFFKKGFGEWSGKMHDDLIDAVDWAVDNGIADANKICIMGGSYGGYAALVGLTFTPDKFACAIDIVGPSNLVTLLNSVPKYWKPQLNFLHKLTGGDHTTAKGKEVLLSKSPITYVDKIKKPLLIGQGANDPRVKQSESDQIVNLMKSKNIPVIYALYPDEGHGFARPENRFSFYTLVEAFLAENLNGKFEKVTDEFDNTSLIIKEGKQNINHILN